MFQTGNLRQDWQGLSVLTGKVPAKKNTDRKGGSICHWPELLLMSVWHSGLQSNNIGTEGWIAVWDQGGAGSANCPHRRRWGRAWGGSIHSRPQGLISLIGGWWRNAQMSYLAFSITSSTTLPRRTPSKHLGSNLILNLSVTNQTNHLVELND